MNPTPLTPENDAAEWRGMTRAERRRQERDQRKLYGALQVAVTRMDLSRVLAPITSELQNQEALLGFIAERGLRIVVSADENMRAVLDMDELKAWLQEKADAKQPEAEVAADA